MLQTLLIVLSCVLAVSVAQVTIDPVGTVPVVEGNNLTITCAEVGSPGSAMRLRQDGVQLTNPDIPPNIITSSMRTYSLLLVNRTANGNTYDCFSIVSTNSSEEIMLTVAFPPTNTLTSVPVVVHQINHTLSCSFDGLPCPNVTWRLNGTTLVTGRDNYVIREVDNSSHVDIVGTKLSNSGDYECEVWNLLGSDSKSVSLTVQAAGLLNDSVRGDPLFSVPLPSEYITDPKLKSVQLCFEVHGQSGNHYNLISDRCTSVTALYSAGVVNTEMNVITKIGVRTQGTNGTCHSVKVGLDNCSASLDGAYVNKSSTASVDGVRLSERRSHIRVSVPNCEASRSITLWVTCTTRFSESLLEVVVSRGDGLEPTAHGVIGQFWNIPLKIEPYVGQYGERLVDLMDKFYSLTVSYPNAPERTFVAKYDKRDWFDNRPCLYAGDSDGGRVSEVPTSDSVIEGTASSYVVQDLFSTDFEFSKYNRDC